MAKDLCCPMERRLRAALRQAIAAAGDDARPMSARVHDLRSALKKANALLRLLDPLLGKRGRRERRRLTAIAQRVGSVRDLGAVVETFDCLVRRGRSRGSSFSELRRRLAARRRAGEQSRETAKQLGRAVRALRLARHRAKGLFRGGDQQHALAVGFRDGYRRARHAMKAARRLRTPEAFHAWRKTVKTHLFHVEVLARAGGAALVGRAAPLATLGQTLGTAHDLTLLESSIRAEPELGGTPGAHRALLAKVHQRRRALDVGALALGRRLFRRRAGAMGRIGRRGQGR